MEISKFAFFMDGRWPEEEVAGVVEVFPQIHHHRH
jgi:hypothetical protein